MCSGLMDAGAELAAVYDPDPAVLKAFTDRYPDAPVARCEDEILEDDRVQLVASAHITCERGPLGLRVQDHGKHYLSDKAPFTALEQLGAARRKVEETGLVWGCCYSERVQNEAGVYAGYLLRDGAIGRVIQVLGLGPHRLNAPSRPPYFFDRKQYGGILCDIGSHQVEQFLSYTGAVDASVTGSRIANYHHPEYPELDDFGDATLVADNGAAGYFRVDWFTPDGLPTWGDGRTLILGTDGYIELRKYLDLDRDSTGDHVFLVDHRGVQHIPVHGKVGFPYFGALIRDCLEGTETAMSQRHTFLAAQLSLEAQKNATRLA
jgi:predicted dehydrogenase